MGNANPEKLKNEAAYRMAGHTFCIYCAQLHIAEVEDAFHHFILKKDEKVYYPQVEIQKRIRGEMRTLLKPMFYNYFFIETNDPYDLYARVTEHIGLTIFIYCRMLRTDTYLNALSAGEEKMVRALCGSDHILKMSSGYKSGDKLIITEGPLKNLSGLIVKTDRHKRTAVLRIPFMGAERYVKVGLEIVKKV